MCNCRNEELEIDGKYLYVEDYKNIRYEINFCPLCGENVQPERSRREDPHLDLEDVENITIDQMKIRMKEMEETILRQYIQMTSCWICPKCVGCGALNSMET
jgi:hypothetical protein